MKIVSCGGPQRTKKYTQKWVKNKTTFPFFLKRFTMLIDKIVTGIGFCFSLTIYYKNNFSGGDNYFISYFYHESG